MSITTTPPPIRTPPSIRLLSTGVPGVDEILGGGLAPNRLYLLEGVPGAGKTTLALHFLLEGVKQNESTLFISLSETREELATAAKGHGWSLDRINILEVLPSEDALDVKDQYTIFHPSEVELSETTQLILREVERVKPARAVIDSISELRLLAGDPLQYRRQMLALKKYFTARHCTVLVLDDRAGAHHQKQGESIVYGVFTMDQRDREYGSDRRRLKIAKYRGTAYQSGYHDFVIRPGGITIFPRLVAANVHSAYEKGEPLSSGVLALDDLIGGGLERGTSTLIAGAPGTGKSSLATQFVVAAARRGQRSIMYIFDESIDTMLMRTDGLSLGLREHVSKGLVTLQQIDAGEMSPGEFAHNALHSARENYASIVVIDSLNGYVHSMPDERFLIVQLRELLVSLRQLGVVTLLVGVHQGLIDISMATGVDASYVADGIILLRFFEASGEIRQTISVIKKRWGEHERTLREFRLSASGVQVGDPLREFRAILTGVPTYEGKPAPFTKSDPR